MKSRPLTRKPMLLRVRKWIREHPKITYTVYLCVFVVVSLEIFLRLYVGFDPGYYMAYARPKPNTVLEYPYGDIKFNSDGYPDDEFEPVKTRPRIGYVGDSNCYGIGAGHGHRITEFLEQRYPKLEHMNLAFGPGHDLSLANCRKVMEMVDRYDLDTVVYLLTLNDILPDADQRNPASIFRIRRWFDWLRGRSYLYTYVRLVVKNFVMRRGYGSAKKAYELYPERYSGVFGATAARINGLAEQLQTEGVDFVVVILPYEMQISEEAERVYRQLGIEWESGFVDRGPQRKLISQIKVPKVVDAYYAFIDEENVAASRSSYEVGECFVYNRGDRMDWHHPNRKGHRVIADFIAEQTVLGPL